MTLFLNGATRDAWAKADGQAPNPDATAYAVTAGSADILQVANSSSGSTVTYDVIIVGATS